MQSEMSPNKMDRQRMIAFISDILPKIKKESMVIITKNNRKQGQEVWSMEGRLPQRCGEVQLGQRFAQ